MSADELKALGNAALQNGKIQEAIDHYTSAIQLDPKNHVLYSNRSAAYCKLKDYKAALADGEKCIELNPSWGKGYTRLGNALEFLGDDKKALEVYRKGLEKEPGNAALKDSIENVSDKLISNPFAAPDVREKIEAHPRLREYLKQPDYCFMLEQLKTNPKFLNTVMSDQRFQQTLLVLMNLDANLMSDEPMDTSEKQESKIPEKMSEVPPKKTDEPQLSEAEQMKAKGNAAYKSRQFEEALEHYRKAFELDYSNMVYLTNEAAVHFEMKNYEESIKVCERAIDVGRENRTDYKLIAKAFARIANSYHQMGDFENAKKFYDKSLTEHRAPDTVKKCQVVERQLKAEKEKAYVNPELAEKEKEEGNKLFLGGKYPEAMKHYSEAIKRNPTDVKLYSNRSACYMKLMEFHSGLKDAEKCIEVDPTFVKGHLRRGACLKALKDPIKAADAYRKALALDENCSEASEGLRQCISSSNDPEAVKRRAMNDPEVQQILNDPAMQIILNQMQKDPKALRDHLQNPDIASKIQKLMEVGLISVM